MADEKARIAAHESCDLRGQHQGIIIQFIGTNGSGKTTAVRRVLNEFSFVEEKVVVRGRQIALNRSTDDLMVCLGRYNGITCGGCDTYKCLDDIKNDVSYFARKKKRVILFESILASGNMKFSSDINRIAKNAGYLYTVVLMNRDLDDSINSIEQRNGGRPFNVKQVVDKYYSCIRTARKLKNKGIQVIEFYKSGWEDLCKLISG